MPGSLFSPRKYLPLLQVYLIFVQFSADPEVWAEDDVRWQRIETRHTIIQYQSPRDLERLNHTVSSRRTGRSLVRLFSSPGPDDPTEAVRKRLDLLFERVREILDMHKKMEKIIINIYSNREQLNSAYEKIYKEPCRVRAWYIYDFNTVYLNLDDMTEGVLAHEMAHAIIDDYLIVRPPVASAEILARYVDAHLHN